MRGGQTKSRPNELAFAPFVFPKGIERSVHNIDPKIVCFAFLQRSSRTSVCSLFFDRASSKSQFNIIASLRPSKTKASTQNLQSHSGNIDHYRCGELILRLLVAFGLWVFVTHHFSALFLMCHWFFVMLYFVVRSL